MRKRLTRKNRQGGFTPYNNCDKSDSISRHQDKNFGIFANFRKYFLGRESARNCNRSCITGFTLVEMMVVIGITVILSTVLMSYNRSGNQQIALNVEQAKIVGFLNRAKAFALEKRITAGQRVCAFGLHFEPPRRIILFRDLPDDLAGSCETGFNKTFDGDIEFMEDFSLDQEMTIESQPGDIVFEPPYLMVYNAGVIKIGLVNGDKAICVEVGQGGAIFGRTCPADLPENPPVAPGV